MSIKEQLRQIIGEGNIKLAINELLDATNRNGQKDLHFDMVMLSSRYQRNEKEKDQGLIESRDYRIEVNKIIASLLSVVDSYKDDGSIQLKETAATTPTAAAAQEDNFVALPEQLVVKVAYKEAHFRDIEPLIQQRLILLVTATSVETRALHQKMAALSEGQGLLQVKKDTATYYVGKFGNFAVAHVECGTMGASTSMGSIITISNAINDLKPAFVLMVGIAFGINSNKQNIGDVLVSDKIIPYEIQRIGADKIIGRGSNPEASNALRDIFKNLLDWDYTLPNGKEAQLEVCDILSGEKLVDSLNFRNALEKDYPTAKGGEMEGAGLYAACQDKKVEWILVKSICDFADGQKSQGKKEKQALAIETALLACLHVFKRTYVFEGWGVQVYKEKE